VLLDGYGIVGFVECKLGIIIVVVEAAVLVEDESWVVNRGLGGAPELANW
jgi:hypothetical protein